MTLDALADEVQEWTDGLHLAGIDLTTNAHLKVEEEAGEYADDQSIEEAADVFISLFASLNSRGYTSAHLALAVKEKLAVNRERTWSLMPDGTYHHD